MNSSLSVKSTTAAEGNDVVSGFTDVPFDAWVDCAIVGRLLSSISPVVPANPNSRSSVSSRAGTGFRYMLEGERERKDAVCGE